MLLSVHVYAVKNYKSGYIITLEGDTVKGYLLYQNSFKSSEICVFKNTFDTDETNYTPNEISGYRFTDGKFYISKQIPADSNQEKDANLKRTTVFMEYFIKGIASIYYMVDDKGEHFYIEKSPLRMIELSEPIRTYDFHYMQPKYKGKLKYLMADCPAMDNQINFTQLSYPSLVKLAKDYQNKVCSSDSCIIFERQPIPVKYRFGLLLGSTVNQYNFGNEIITNYSLGYQIGITMKIMNAIFSDEKFDIDIDLLLENETRYKLEPFKNWTWNTYISYNGNDYIMHKDRTVSLPVNFKIIALKMPVVLDYKFVVKKLSFYAGLGVTGKYIMTYNRQFQVALFENQYKRTINSFLIGGIGKVGFEKKLYREHSVSLKFSYEYIVDPRAANMFLRLKETIYSFHLGYIF
jgi:hypothetical protein